jgi:hypothetical protein
MPPVSLRKPDGSIVFVPEDRAAHAEALGWKPVGTAEAGAELTTPENDQGGVLGAIGAGVESTLSGATLGLSDVAARALLPHGDVEAMRQRREAHPIVSTIGQVAGAVVPAIATGGESLAAEPSLLAALPAARVGRLGREIAGLGEGAGVVGRVAATAGAGAAEGALQNAGGYISDVALGDRDLTADGFFGAMGQGAFWGGVGGGALQLAGEGLQTARRLFPKAEMTAEGARAARGEAVQAIRESLDDTGTMVAKGETRLAEIGAQEEITNPVFKQRKLEIQLKQAEDMARARVAREQFRAQEAEYRARGVAERQAAARTKPALDFLKRFEVPAEEAGGSLEAQLAKTKEALDSGRAISEIHGELARVNPEAAKINEAIVAAKDSAAQMRAWLDRYAGGMVELDAMAPKARAAAMRDWAEKYRPVTGEDESVVRNVLAPNEEKTYLRVGGGEGPIGNVSGFSPEVNAAAKEAAAKAAHGGFHEGLADALNVSVTGPEAMARATYAGKKAAARAADEAYVAARAPRETFGAVAAPTGAEILAASPPSAKIARAMEARPASFADEIAETAPLITKHEAAHADLAEMLGPDAPASSQARAAGFRDAQKTSAGKAEAQIAHAADAMQKQPGLAARALGAAGNAGAAYEALRMMGVPLPNPHDVPVIGPVLSAYLKAKVIGKAFGRHGGGILQTAETTIAGKAAATRQRIYQAADAALGIGAKGARAAAPVVGGAAAILGHTLFDDGRPKPAPAPYTSQPKAGSLGDLYLERAGEIDAASRPGAIADAVRARVNTSDPDQLRALIDAKTRQLQYLASTMPRPGSPGGPLDGRVWFPAKADLSLWAKDVAATEDPAGVMERAARGEASAREIAAVKAVAPSLYRVGQLRVMSQLADGKAATLSTAQRTAVARAWGIPVDAAGRPDTAAFLQAAHAATATPPQPSGSPGGAPSIAGPINVGRRTMTRLDGGHP